MELAWLRVDTSESPSINTVALIVDGPLDPALLRERIEDRLLPLPRLRQRLEPSPVPLARPHWREHGRFQLADHFFEMGSDAGEGSRSLGALVDRVLSLPMDESLPLWQVHSLELDGDRSALILRIHAAIADSRASAALALRLVDSENGEALELTQVGLEHQLPLQTLLDAQRGTVTATRMLCQLITSRADRENPFRHPSTRVRSAGWSTPISLSHLESLSTRHGFAAAELLLAAVASAMRKAAHRLDTPADDLEVRAVVPLDLRRPGDSPVGTRSALGLLRLPVHESSVTARLESVHSELERFSMKPENVALLGLDADRGLSMTEIEERSIRLICRKASVALAVLDGPTEIQSIFGQPISELVWWPALNKKMALGISIVAYADQVRFGASCDESLQTDAATLAADMAGAIAES